MTIDLPKPVADYVAANAQMDVDAMLQPFARGAVVHDVGIGKRFEGRNELRVLFEEEVIPVKAIFTPDVIRHKGGRVIVEGDAHGDFKGSPVRFTYDFRIENDVITALEIRP